MARKTLRIPTTIQPERRALEVWKVFRLNPDTDQIEEFEVTCEAGTFPAAYRLLGRTEGGPGPFEEFDIYEDAWARELVAEYRS